MVMPVEQTCPKCHNRHMGSDVLGMPCFECEVEERTEARLGRPLTDEERAQLSDLRWMMSSGGLLE